MHDSLANVVIPYSRFLEDQERRRSGAAELTRRDRQLTEPGSPSAPARAAETS